MELLGHTITLGWDLWGPDRLVSKVAAPLCIYASGVWGVRLLVFSAALVTVWLSASSHAVAVKWGVIVASVCLCLWWWCWPSSHVLISIRSFRRNVCSDLLSIYKLGYFSFYYWDMSSLYILQRTLLLENLQKFFFALCGFVFTFIDFSIICK